MAQDSEVWAARDGLGRETPVVFTPAGGVVLPVLAKRIGIVIYPPAVDDIVVSFRDVPSLASGLRIKAGGPPVVLSLDDFGPLVAGQLFGKTLGAANQAIGVVETGYKY